GYGQSGYGAISRSSTQPLSGYNGNAGQDDIQRPFLRTETAPTGTAPAGNAVGSRPPSVQRKPSRMEKEKRMEESAASQFAALHNAAQEDHTGFSAASATQPDSQQPGPYPPDSQHPPA